MLTRTPTVPTEITVHLGPPDSAAKNITEKGTTAVLNFLDKTSNFLKGFKK